MRHIDLGVAYRTLGLSQGASLEEVKSAYKKLALQYHPDKNPAPDATEQFQKIGGAYARVLEHLNGPPQSSFRATHPSHYDHREDDEDEGYYYFDDEDEDEDAYMDFLLQAFRRGGRGGYGGPGYDPRLEALIAQREALEREKMLEHRRREHEEKVAAEKFKEEQRNQRLEEEKRQAAKRKEAKKQRKKDEWLKGGQEREEVVKQAKRDSQKKRSLVFEMARKDDAAAVKKAIWEEGVDAAGGECLPGLEQDDLFNTGSDPKEALLHIFVRKHNPDMVRWLLDHNAEPEDRDSFNRTAFHIALQQGSMPLVKMFLEAFPPEEEEFQRVLEPPVIQDTPPVEYSLLRLAMDSGNPEVVQAVLKANLADRDEVKEAWEFICSSQGWKSPGKGYASEREHVIKPDLKWNRIRDLVMTAGGFSPPSPPAMPPPPKVEPPVAPEPMATTTTTTNSTGTSSKKGGKKKNKNSAKATDKEQPIQPSGSMEQVNASSNMAHGIPTPISTPNKSKDARHPTIHLKTDSFTATPNAANVTSKTNVTASIPTKPKPQVDTAPNNGVNLEEESNDSGYPSPVSPFPATKQTREPSSTSRKQNKNKNKKGEAELFSHSRSQSQHPLPHSQQHARSHPQPASSQEEVGHGREKSRSAPKPPADNSRSRTSSIAKPTAAQPQASNNTPSIYHTIRPGSHVPVYQGHRNERREDGEGGKPRLERFERSERRTMGTASQVGGTGENGWDAASTATPIASSGGKARGEASRGGGGQRRGQMRGRGRGQPTARGPSKGYQDGLQGTSVF